MAWLWLWLLGVGGRGGDGRWEVGEVREERNIMDFREAGKMLKFQNSLQPGLVEEGTQLEPQQI